MRGDVLLEILERIGEGVDDLVNLSFAILEAGYGASYSRVEYIARTRRSGRKVTDDREKRLRHRCSQLIYHLRKDGLITEADVDKQPVRLTPKGKEILKALKKKRQSYLPQHKYIVEKSSMFTIVIFDVPESEKKKREWLREALKSIGFTFVQKSVWLGKLKVPVDLLQDIERLQLAEYIEIFQITKTGSLKQLI